MKYFIFLWSMWLYEYTYLDVLLPSLLLEVLSHPCKVHPAPLAAGAHVAAAPSILAEALIIRSQINSISQLCLTTNYARAGRRRLNSRRRPRRGLSSRIERCWRARPRRSLLVSAWRENKQKMKKYNIFWEIVIPGVDFLPERLLDRAGILVVEEGLAKVT